MPPAHPGLGPFLAQLRSRLDGLHAQELISLLLAHAESLAPAERQPFLAIFAAEPPATTAGGAGLLEEIAAFVERLRGGEYVDGWGWDDDLHAERNWGDESWVTEMDELFCEAAAAFLGGEPHLARDAYCELLDALGRDEDGGTFSGALPPDEMLQTDIAEAKARALRLLYETATRDERVDTLAGALADWRYLGARVGLREILDARPAEPPQLDAFAEQWIGRFSPQLGQPGHPDERTFLIEVATWRDGPDGVAALARRWGDDVPALFVAWVDALLAADRKSDAAAACVEALASLPAHGDARAEIAERHAPLDTTPGHGLSCARVAWRAAPSALRLRRLVGHADAATLCVEADALAGTSPSARLSAALLVLAGRIDEASALLGRCEPLGWSRDDHPGAVVVPVLLIAATAPATGGAGSRLPAATALLTAVDQPGWSGPGQIGHGESDGAAEVEALVELSALLAARAATVDGTADLRAEWLIDARAAIDARVAAIVTAQHRGAYDRAAQLATAGAEAIAAVDGATAATAMLVGLRERYPRHVAFRSSLEGAVRRSPRLSPLPKRRR